MAYYESVLRKVMSMESSKQSEVRRGPRTVLAARVVWALAVAGLLLIGLAAGIATGADVVVGDDAELVGADAATDGAPSTHAVLKTTGDGDAGEGLVVAEAVYALEAEGDILYFRWAGEAQENVPYDGCDGRALVSIGNPEGGWDLVAERSGKSFDEVGTVDIREYVEDGEIRLKFEAVSEHEDGFWASSQVNVHELTFDEDVLPEDAVPLSMAGGVVVLVLVVILGAIILRGAF